MVRRLRLQQVSSHHHQAKVLDLGATQNLSPLSHLESPDVSRPLAPQHGDSSDSHVDDFMKISASRTTADTILLWPIFQETYSPDCLVGILLHPEDTSDGNSTPQSVEAATSICISGSINFKEHQVKDLVENFLAYVHIKNPILDVETLRNHARRVIENGPGWDGMSCLVLLSCALGALAKPFDATSITTSETSSRTQHKADLTTAESNYTLARRRIGVLGGSIIRSQCYFWSGVYLMYTFRPVEAWHNFLQASSTYHIYLKGQVKKSTVEDIDLSMSRSLEQRLYWSCFKSECEIRVELNLPESSIATINYPDMFPSPPEEKEIPVTTPGNSPIIEAAMPSGIRRQQYKPPLFGQSQQRQSWYYYLSEIVLRRIMNRVLNAFHTNEHYSGFTMPMQNMVNTALEFLDQLSQWYDGLPSAIKYSEDYTCIPTEELTYMTRARVLDIRSLIFRPFLYYAVHYPVEDHLRALVQPFVDNALETARVVIESQTFRHRHHGTWFGLRSGTAGALSLIAANRCGHIEMPGGWRETIQMQIDTLQYWEEESVDLAKARKILIAMLVESI